MSDDISVAIENLAYAVKQGFPHDPTADKRMFCEVLLQHAGSAEFAADMTAVVAIFQALVSQESKSTTRTVDQIFEEAWDAYRKVKKSVGTGIHHMMPASNRY